MSYRNEGNEVRIDSHVKFVGLLDCSLEPSSIVTKKKATNEAAAIKNWASEFSQYFAALQLKISPNKVELSSVPPETAIVGSIEILKDQEISICDTGTSNRLTFSKVGCSTERPSKTQSQRISGRARKVESKIDLPSIVCDRFGNELTRVTLKEVSYK